MSDIRDAIDLFIQVCDQPGTGNPVGQATVQGALNAVNRADQEILRLRQRLTELIPNLDPTGDECLLLFNRTAEIIPIVYTGAIYGDSITRRTFARGYCFNGIAGQLINIQVLPIPPAELEVFLAISSFDNPTDFIAINQSSAGARQTVGPITLPETGRYLIIIADLQEDGGTRASFGEYAFLLSDLSFGNSTRNIIFDEATNSVIIDEPAQLGFAAPTEQVQAVCPSLAFSCNELFSCAEVAACLAAGNFALDQDGDGIGCNEPNNLLSGALACTP